MINLLQEMYGDIIDDYLRMTGQTFKELMSGSFSFGYMFIEELAAKCLLEKKMIVWKVERGLDHMSYTLVDVE